MNGRWAEPQRVSAVDNTVPDIMPQPTLQTSGLPSVSWLGFDTTADQYRYFRSDWTGKHWTRPVAIVANPLGARNVGG